ncbi:MAG: sigma-70 family RNA polymerase sigma factor [Pirellulaceae bacterium]|nr:sigma-70 family RNA polymerase sigma factor [Planctomycetales bacterium]
MNRQYGENTEIIQRWVERLRDGDTTAREELLNVACARLMHLTRQIKRGFERVGRWEQTEDVFQRASMRLYRSLEKVELNDAQHFLRLAAQQIRRELIDLSRSYGGPEGLGANHYSQAGVERRDEYAGRAAFAFDPAELSLDPQKMQEWSEFHQLIDGLPEQERTVVDLLWYHGLSQEDAARLMDVSVRTVRRTWRSARLALHEKLGGSLPGE